MPKPDARDRLRTLVRGKGGSLVAAPAGANVARVRHQGAPAPLAATDQDLKPQTGADGAQLTAADNMPVVAHQIAPMPADPLRPTVWAGGSRARWILRLRRLWRWLAARLPFRSPTPQERRQRVEMSARRQLERQLREEAVLFKKRLTNALDRLGLCYYYPKGRSNMLFDRSSVRFDVVRLQPEAICFHVDTARLPRGVNVMQLMQPDVLTDLTLSCGVRVTAEYSEKIGAWYILERATGARGVPLHVPYADMFDRFPEKEDGLSIAFGLQSNNRAVYRSLSEMPHLLVGGTTGAGKSNFLNSVLCSWISRNHPSALQIIAVDLKGGMEFNPYRDVPHIMQVPGLPKKIINDREQVQPALKWLFGEVERRIALIEGAGKNNFAKYNKGHKANPLPRIVLVIDEYADLALFSKLKAAVEPLLTNICQRARAVGVHVLLCTQRPEVAVISGNIKGVLPVKVAFNCTNNASSMVILDNTSAKGLGAVGRCILQMNGVEVEVQTPYMPDDLVTDIIRAAVAKQGLKLADLRKHDVTPDEIMRWALANTEGEIAANTVYQNFRARGLVKEEVLAWLKEWEGQQFVVNGSLYRVEPGMGTRPRRLVAEISKPVADEAGP